MVCGNCLPAAVIAACTSCAAASMLRLRSNCSTIVVAPSALSEVICVTPAIWPNWRSSGAATVDAIVSGAGARQVSRRPGWSESRPAAAARPAATGTPRCRRSASAAISSEVAIGRRMKGSEMFMGASPAAASWLDVIDRRIGLQLVLAVGHHTLAFRNAGGDDRQVAAGPVDFDRRGCAVPVGDNPGEQPLRAALDGNRRNDQRIGSRFDEQPGIDE